MSVTENFEYGKDNLASKYIYPSGKTTTYTYDEILRRNSTVINTTAPIQQTYKYMASARGHYAKTTKIEEEILGGNSYKYTYDANGNITSVLLKKSTESAYTKQQQFAYDELNQLIRADDLAKNRTEVYTYDNGGNILSTTVYPLTWGSLSGVTATDTTTYTYGDSNWKDKLTAYGDTPITYDAIGNPLTYRGYTLTWQNGRQLASMKFRTINIGFTYDVDGLRTSKTIPNVGLEHKYYYVGDRLQYETLGGSSALWYFYDADGNPSGIRYKDNSGTVNDYYFVCNWRGDVIQIYNASGTLVGSYTYDAWGRVTENATSADTQNITETNPIRYRGYYYDTETRLYYVNSRYYDPAVKRMLNADDDSLSTATPQGLTDKNYFAYCDNNPVVRVDSNGEFWNYVVGAVVGGAIGAVSTAIAGGDAKAVVLSAGIGAVGGLIGASGLPAVAQIVAGGVLGGAGNFANQFFIEKISLENIDWGDIIIDSAIGAAASAISYGITKNASQAASNLMGKGAYRVVKGEQRILKGDRYGKAAIKRGMSTLQNGIKRMNTARGKSSVVGSLISGFVTGAKNIFRKIFR